MTDRRWTWFRRCGGTPSAGDCIVVIAVDVVASRRRREVLETGR